jgi:hypothetical protein
MDHNAICRAPSGPPIAPFGEIIGGSAGRRVFMKISDRPQKTPFYCPVILTIIFSHRNALNLSAQFFMSTAKNRPPNPSKIRVLEFKGEFRRFGLYPVSKTIDNDRSIFAANRHGA